MVENPGTEQPDNKKKSRSLLGKLFRIFIFGSLISATILGSSVVLLFVYENEVKAAILKELNKHLKAEVKVDPKNIDLTIIRTFPDCSLRFQKVLMLEALSTKSRDTLLYSEELSLHFNIRDLWNKKYEINKIRLRDGTIKLRVLKSGLSNYIFWEETQEGEKAAFNLKSIRLENFKLSYTDFRAKLKATVEVKRLSFKGNFRESDYALSADGDIFIRELVQGKTSFLKKKDLQMDVDLQVRGKEYLVKKADLSVNDLAIKATGKFIYGDSLEKLSTQFEAPRLQIVPLLSLLPEKYRAVINDYESKGEFYAKGNFNYASKKSFSLRTEFGIRNAQIRYKPGATSADNVNLEGILKYSNTSSLLQLNNVSLKLKEGEVKGNFKMSDFSKPYLQFTAQAILKLENVLAFWPVDTLESLKGDVNFNANVEGLLSDLKTQTFGTKVQMDLQATVKQLEARFKHDDKTYAVENCTVKAKDREIKVEDLSLRRGSSDLRLNGSIPGLFNYILDKTAPLIISGQLDSKNIHLEDFMVVETKGGEVENENPFIPLNMRFKFDARIGKFTFGKFEAEDISGDIEIKEQRAMINEVRLRTMGGEAEINAFVDNSRKKIELVLQSNFKNIDINEMFRQMNSFGQTTIQDKNIKGIVTATVDFSANWNNNLKVNENSIQASSSFLIERGELVDFKPLMILSRFVNVEDLQRIKFSTLQSNVQISNRTITIPKTSIRNSALNLDAWGTHTFDNKIDYHVQLLLTELLHRKRKRNDSEFGPVENDTENRRMAFIRMTGTLDKPIVKYDKQGMKAKIGSDIKQEKQNIKAVLREEFGLFKKDSLLKRKKPEPVFELETPEKTPPKKPLELKKKAEDEEDF